MRPSLAIAYALALAALVGGLGFFGARIALAPASLIEEGSVWRDAAWPFLRDGWPAGRAFRCDAADCGEEVMVYARVKKGMCDCVAGVADDEDLERVSDAPLLSQRFTPLAEGQVQTLSGMSARLRRYRLDSGAALAVIAGGRNCNAFVAMASARHELSPRSMDAVKALLEAPPMSRWVARQAQEPAPPDFFAKDRGEK